MLLGSVHIPDELVRAAKGTDFVLFVGAGASVAPPSSLPTFDALTALVAREALVSFEENDPRGFDARLASLEDRFGVDVHERVAVHVDAPGSAPNALHGAIAYLASSSGALRVVTTNYDRHLTTAIESRLGKAVPEFLAPALPVGDDFEGVVYLHGKLGQNPRCLVATDNDFGRAYLTDAWAARFLERMFGRYTSLFIGYSHEDTVMSYLARGLRYGEPARYALASSDSQQDWERLGITALSYVKQGRDHSALDLCLSAWAATSEMGLVDQRSRIQRIVQEKSEPSAGDLSYLSAAFQDPATLQLFVQFARGEYWLDWASSQPGFDRLFTANPGDEVATPLAWWFAYDFVLDEGLSLAAMELVRRFGGGLGLVLGPLIGQGLHSFQDPRPAWLDPWLVLLLHEPLAPHRQWLEYALLASKGPEHAPMALLLFDRLLEPTAVLSKAWGTFGPRGVSVEIQGEEWAISSAWDEVIRPQIRALAERLLSIVDRHLRRSQALADSLGHESGEWDRLSRSRSSIALHPQDEFREPLHILIDAGRDSLEILAVQDPPLLDSLTKSWLASGSGLLMRMAVFAWTLRTDRTTDECIAFILEEALLTRPGLRAEVFDLLAKAAPSLSPTMTEALIEEVMERSWSEIEGSNDYERLNALSFLHDRAPENTLIREAFTSALPLWPTFQQRPFPGLLSWHESGASPRWHFDTGSLHARLENELRHSVEELLDLPVRTWPDETPSLEAGLEALQALVSVEPELGFRVLALELDSELGLERAVLRGWTYAAPGQSGPHPAAQGPVLDAALDWMTRADVEPLVSELAAFLEQHTRDEGAPLRASKAGMELAALLCRALGTPPEQETSERPMRDALDADLLWEAQNRPAGQLAEFLVRSFWDGRAPDSPISELSDEAKSTLEAMLVLPGTPGVDAQVVLFSLLGTLFALDLDWTLDHLLPLLLIEDNSSVPVGWHGVLHSPSCVAADYLAAVLMVCLLDLLPRADFLGKKLRPYLVDFFARAAFTARGDPMAWLPAFTAAASPQFQLSPWTWCVTTLTACVS